ncbi:FecR domain-containing protein, partial [Rickettsiales bacterium]|nr:FecR domain-containing protein [Rickettsiales bacterium]
MLGGKLILKGLLGAIFLSGAISFPSIALSADKIGVVGAANSYVGAVSKDKKKRDLALGADIFFNDTIVTDAKGNAQLLFIDKSALTVGPNAKLVIDKFVYNPQTGNGGITLKGSKGAFRFIGGALSKKKAVKIKTPVGTIGIRGGIAMVDINPSTGASEATFIYGQEMTFQNQAGVTQTVTEPG